MKNIALKVFWTNSPMPVSHKIKNPDITLDIPFGNILFVNSGTGIDAPVKSVNEKTGHVVLSASDVLADPIGSAEIVKTQLENQIKPVQILAEINQLNLSKKADQFELEQTQIQVESNRLILLNKADLTAIAMLTTLIDTKADQHYVQEQIANLVNGDQSIINAIQEIATALKENEDLIQALDYTVANRVRFDIANQALTALQKFNARTNINAEESGTAAILIAQITAQTLGAATAAQGSKADTALQSADVAPVALSGLFSSLSGQNKIFDVVYAAYTEGVNAEITAADTLGMMLGKLQKQIKSKGGGDKWVSINEIGTLVNSTNNLIYAEEYFIDGVGGFKFCIKDNVLWFKALFRMKISISGTGWPLFTITDPAYFPKVGTNNETVLRPAGHQLNAGSILTQYTYYLSKPSGATGFQLHSAQSLNAPAIYSILPTPIGFI